MTELSSGVVATLTFNEARLAEVLAAGFSQATDVAEQLMLSCNIDYRSAYQVVGGAVRRLSQSGRTGADLTVALLDEVAVELLGGPLGMDPEVLASTLDPAAIVATRVAPGGAAPKPMVAMLGDTTAQAAALTAAARARLDAFDEAEDTLRREARRVLEGES